MWASQVALAVKNLLANAQGMSRKFDTWIRKIPRRRAWQPTPVFLLGESHGQRSLAGYRPWGHKELDTTKRVKNINNKIDPDGSVVKNFPINAGAQETCIHSLG